MRPAVFSASRLRKMKPKDSICSNTTLSSGKERPTTSPLIAFMTLQARIQLSRPSFLKSTKINLCRRWLCRGWNLTVHESAQECLSTRVDSQPCSMVGARSYIRSLW